MAATKTSDETAASTLDGTELVRGVQSAANVKITVAQIKTWASNSPALITPALGTPSSGVGTNITNVNAATLGGATFAAPGAIGGGTPAAIAGTTLALSGSTTYSVVTAGPILKQGANGRVGTFVLNGSTPVTVNNSSIAITDAIIFSLNTVGGVVGVHPTIATITAASGFTVAGTAADTSTYNYAIIKNAA